MRHLVQGENVLRVCSQQHCVRVSESPADEGFPFLPSRLLRSSFFGGSQISSVETLVPVGRRYWPIGPLVSRLGRHGILQDQLATSKRSSSGFQTEVCSSRAFWKQAKDWCSSARCHPFLRHLTTFNVGYVVVPLPIYDLLDAMSECV